MGHAPSLPSLFAIVIEFTISLSWAGSVSGGEFFQRSSGLSSRVSSVAKSGTSGNSEYCRSISVKRDEGRSGSAIANLSDTHDFDSATKRKHVLMTHMRLSTYWFRKLIDATYATFCSPRFSPPHIREWRWEPPFPKSGGSPNCLPT